MSRKPISIGDQEALGDISEPAVPPTAGSRFRYKTSSTSHKPLTMQGSGSDKVVQLRADSPGEAAMKDLELRRAVAAAAYSQ